MQPERWQQISRLFQAALERDADDRSAFLDEACAGDDALRREVQSLISSHGEASNFIESPVYEVAAPLFAGNHNRFQVGESVGPYRIVSQLGSGGMGEVYRARDARLGRYVAIKVVLEAFSNDADRVRRFEQEARAASMLNHPNILAIYDVGTHNGTPYVVSELLAGETLRNRLIDGALSRRKAIDYALQIVEGLAAAHEKGITHRDLKPENLFVTQDGRVKVLDFGLAKLTEPQGSTPHTEATTLLKTSATEPGMIVGTVGYMSPEQVRGERVDSRSDLFSFGAILYEMLTGKHAFQAGSAVETMNAILKDEPAELTEESEKIPPAIQRIIQHCLEKNPRERFQSAGDIGFALEALSGVSSTSVAALRAESMRRSYKWVIAVGVPLLVAALALGAFLGMRAGEKSLPSFQQLTFHNGTIRSARFAPDGKTIIYSAAWEGQPIEIFSTRIERPESRSLGLTNANVLAISSAGEMAILRNYRVDLFAGRGTLAEVPLEGGSPRDLLDNVQEADYASNGKDLAVIYYTNDGLCRLEFPIGKLLYETHSPAWLSNPRVSPNGDRIAFIEHPVLEDDLGSVNVVDLAGKKSQLGPQQWESAFGLSWSPDANEIWFTAANRTLNDAMYAVTLSGKQRLVYRMAGRLNLYDVARDGRVLAVRTNVRGGVLDLAPGETKERDLSWFDTSAVSDISADGNTLLISETGEAGLYTFYLRQANGSPPVQIGDGFPIALSPDGKWVLANRRNASPPQLILQPTGTGETRLIPPGNIKFRERGAWFPDSRRVLLVGSETDRRPRCYLWDLDSNGLSPVTPEGITGGPITPDGKYFVAGGAQQKRSLYPTDGGEPRLIAGLEGQDTPLRFSNDGKSLYVAQGNLPIQIFRLDLASGRRELLKELAPSDPTGLLFTELPRLSADGKSYAYAYLRELDDLFLMEHAR